MRDQAEVLRQRINNIFVSNRSHTRNRGNTRIITVTSGKGGVGKSNFALNFALCLIQQQKKVLIFDVDVGFANIDVLLGFSPKQTVVKMIEEELSIWEIIEEGPHGLQFIAGGSGFSRLLELDERKLQRFFEQLSQLQGYVDYIILDTGAGLSPESLRYIAAADDVILVTTPEPTSYMDAYAVLKMVHSHSPSVQFNFVINRCQSIKEGRQTFNKLHLVANQFLNKQIHSLGFIPEDAKISKAVKEQSPFYLQFPECKASNAIREITATFLNTTVENSSGVKGFLRKMFNKLR